VNRAGGLLAAFALCVCGVGGAHEPAAGAKAPPASSPVRRALDLVDQDGVRVTDRTFHGRPLLVFFGFVSCPDVCPTGLATVAKATRQLEARGIAVTPVFITVDPERDGPQLLRQYVREFHPRMVGLTGSKTQVAQAAAAYGVQYGVQKNAGAYYVWHSSETFLVGARGELLDTLAPHAPAEAIVASAAAKLPRKRQDSTQ
jgi:protein SCO1/2